MNVDRDSAFDRRFVSHDSFILEWQLLEHREMSGDVKSTTRLNRLLPRNQYKIRRREGSKCGSESAECPDQLHLAADTVSTNTPRLLG